MRQNTLITNYLAKCLELSVLVWGYMRGIPLYQIPLLIGLFHTGYLVSAHVPIMNWRKPLSGILIITGLGLLLYGFYTANIFILSGGILMTASFIIQLKDNIKKDNPISVTSKFISKSLGMASAVMMQSKFDFLLLIIFLAVPLLYVYVRFCINHVKIITRENKLEVTFQNKLNWIQFFHHIHYFLFCYTFWALIKNINAGYYSVLFILGWIAYYYMEKRYKKGNKTFRVASICYGHVFSGLTVLLMLFIHLNSVILFLWFVTGFGGGTIYMLRHSKEKEEFPIFEDWGHVMGCVMAGTIIYFTNSIQLTLILASISAVTVAVISFFDNRKIHS